MAENHRAVSKMQERFGSAVIEIKEFRGETTVVVKKESIVEIGKFLRDELKYTFLVDVTAVDNFSTEPRFSVVYHLRSYTNKDSIRIKVPVSDGETIDTVSTVWSTANWLERETWDMFGITFDNHPDLRRILMTDDWVGHPLRKDYPLQGPGREPYKGRLS